MDTSLNWLTKMKVPIPFCSSTQTVCLVGGTSVDWWSLWTCQHFAAADPETNCLAPAHASSDHETHSGASLLGMHDCTHKYYNKINLNQFTILENTLITTAKEYMQSSAQTPITILCPRTFVFIFLFSSHSLFTTSTITISKLVFLTTVPIPTSNVCVLLVLL